MKISVGKVLDLLQAFEMSAIYEHAAPEGSHFREDCKRIRKLAEVALCSSPIQEGDIDVVENHRTSLCKGKGPFQSGMTIYPVGAFICDQVQGQVSQFRKDKLLEMDLVSAFEQANALKVPAKDSIIKQKDGEVEIVVPGTSKIGEITMKYYTFLADASPTLQELSSSKQKAAAIKAFINDINTVLVEAVVHKYESKFAELSSALISLENPGEFTDEKAAVCNKFLAIMPTYQPFHKVGLAKLVGKDLAAAGEAAVSQLGKLGQALLDGIPKLSLIAKGVVNEVDLVNKEVVALYACLNSKECRHAQKLLVPFLEKPLDVVETFITSAVKDWMLRTSSTFRSFISFLLEPEIVIQKALAREHVGEVDVEDKEGHQDVDYPSVYLAFVSVNLGKKFNGMNISFPHAESGEDREVAVHGAFLCIAGMLLQMSKYTVYFIEKIEAVSGEAAFENVINGEGGSEPKIFDLQLLGPLFSRFCKASQGFSTLLETVDVDIGFLENEKTYHSLLMTQLQECLTKALGQCNRELSSVAKTLNGLFTSIKEKHELPALFQDKLEKNVVADLVSNPMVKKFLTAGGQAKCLVQDMTSFLASAEQLMPFVKGNVKTMLASLKADMHGFSNTQCTKEMPKEGAKFTLSNFTWFQGSVTMAQVLTRDLQPGETRIGLVSRCSDLIQKSQLGLEPALKARVTQLKGK